MEKKICSKCVVEKDICEFGVNKSNKNGLRSQCKECCKIEGRLYRENNVEKRKKTIKNWYEKNTDYNKEYYQNNKDSINRINQEWYYLNQERHYATSRLWHENNIDKVRQYNNKRIKTERKTDPLKKLIFNMRTRIYSILKNKTISKKNKTFDVVGCSPISLKEHLEKQFTDRMSWENQGQWHIDHITPLSSATSEEEIYKLCHYTNLQPLWAEDNLRKGSKILS